MALCLESQMGLHASQRGSILSLSTIEHTRLALQPAPPSSRAQLPVRTRRPPVLQRRPSVFSPMTAHISFTSTVRFLLRILFGRIPLIKCTPHPEAAALRCLVCFQGGCFWAVTAVIKGQSAFDLLLFVWEDQAANL